METNKILKTLLVITSVGLIILTYQQRAARKQIDGLEQSVGRLENQIVNDVDQSISQRLELLKQDLLEASSKLSEVTFTSLGVDRKKGIVTCQVTVETKQEETGDQIFVSAKGEDGSEVSVECEKSSFLTYVGQLELPYKTNYSCNIYQRKADGTVEKINEFPHEQYIKNEMEERTRVQSTSTSESEESLWVSVDIENQTFGDEAFGIEKAELIVFKGKEEVIRKDITNNRISDAEEQEMQMEASGDTSTVSSSYSVYENDLKNWMDSGIEYVSYAVSFVKSDMNLPDSPKKAEGFQFRMILTFKDGSTKELQF